jgi:pyruvate dehydrogenase E1 component
MYRLEGTGGGALQLLGAGCILQEVLAAAKRLRADWGVQADVWSVTSFTELRRDGMACERAARFGEARESWVARCLGETRGPVIAASDYVRAVADLIRPYVPRRYVVLGTDGYGRSDTRERLRDFFEVGAKHIALAALAALAEEGGLERSVVAQALRKYGLDTRPSPPWER